MKQLGIFGGTFNPIHNGHLSLCTQLCGALEIPEVLLIPTAIPPHKRAEDLVPGPQRMDMCELAAKEDPRFLVSDLELRRKGNSYTVETLRQLEKQYPYTRMYLFMGTDMFLTVQNWYEANEIFRRAVLVAGARRWDEEEQLKEHAQKLTDLGAACHVVSCKPMDVSSTQVRALCKKGADITGLVPDAVADYIRTNHLYGSKEDALGNH